MHESEKWKWSHSVVSDSWRPHGLQPNRLFRPWDFTGKSTGVGCHCLASLTIKISKSQGNFQLLLKSSLTLVITSCWNFNGAKFISARSPLDCKETKPVNLKGNQFWIFIGRTDVEAETPVLWPPDEKNWLVGKDHDAGKDWRQEEKGTTRDEMVRWLHQLDEHEFEQASGVGNGQGGLACCSPWGHRELDTTEWLNWTEMLFPYM